MEEWRYSSTELRLVPSSKMVELYIHCLTCLHGIVLTNETDKFTFVYSYEMIRDELAVDKGADCRIF
jgi:hypothetical protein